MTTADLQAGRLEQACPDCGTWEAAGSVCTKCLRPMTAADWYRNGDLERREAVRQAVPNVFPPAFLTRFWAKVQKDPDGCWTWTASQSTSGYGVIGAGGHSGLLLRAHRVSWELANGPIPTGLYVCHSCDNPPCVRPDHLFLGTNRENQLDAVAKGRINVKRPREQRDLNAKRVPPKRGPGRPSRASLPDDGTLFGMTTPLRSESGDGPTSLVPLHGTELGPSPDVEGRHGLRGQSPR